MNERRSTGIEWTLHTWNPFVGCTILTPGCARCYAMAQAARIERMQTTAVYDGTTTIANGKPVWTGKINSASAATWRKPFTIKDPSILFVNSMSDFFHESAPDAWRLDALGIMAATPHQYQVLTKRPDVAQRFLREHDVELPDNVWLGATVERGDFRHRIDRLRSMPATIRFLSIEPIIGRIGELDLADIHWVIGGGESGPGARSMQADWAREVRDECARQGVPFFWKQWGQAKNNPLFSHRLYDEHWPTFTPAQYVRKIDPIGKGGSLIDGIEHKAYPAFTARTA